MERLYSIKRRLNHIICGMDKIGLLLHRNEVQERKYVFEKLTALGVKKIEERGYVKYVYIELDKDPKTNEYLAGVIADLITSFYKFRVLISHIKDIKCNIYEYYSLIGALLSTDIEKEKILIRRSLQNVKMVTPRALIELRLPSLIDNWVSLYNLASALIPSSPKPREIFELISYFLADGDNAPRLTITDSDPLSIAINGEIIKPIPFTDNSDLNLLLTAIREHPSHIVIKNQERLSESLLNTFRALGQ